MAEKVLNGRIYKYRLGCGNVRVIVASEGGLILEVFCISGKSGGCSLSFTQALGKAVSIALRKGVEPEEMVRMLAGIACNNGGWNGGTRVESCSDAVAHALRAEMARERHTSQEGHPLKAEGQGEAVGAGRTTAEEEEDARAAEWLRKEMAARAVIEQRTEAQ